MILLYLFLFVFGLVMGAFLNVCIYRIPRNQSIIQPPSHCTGCGNRLGVVDLVPVLSYVFLRGRCRYCRERISTRYPLIECITAVLYVLLFYIYGYSIEFVAAVFLMSVLIIVFFIDYDFMIIPDKLVIAGLTGGAALFVYNLLEPVSFYGDRNWCTPLLGAVVGSGFLLLVAAAGSYLFKTEDAMGGGDIKILAPIGIFLGWKLLAVSLFLSVLLAGGTGLLLVLMRRISKKSSIPFGPFIVTGTFLTLIWGWEIINWYLNIF